MRQLTLFLAALFSTVAIAWALAAWSPRQLTRTPDPALAKHPSVLDWPTDGVSWYSSDAFGVSVIFAQYQFDTPTRGIGWDSAVYSAGLTMRCLYGTYQVRLPNPASPLTPISRTPSVLEHGIPIPRSIAATPLSDLFPARFLPVRPIWSGLAVNTAVTAAALYVLVRVPGALRRSFRRRNGRCVSCDHPLVGSARCPECGAPTQDRAAHEAG